MAFLFPAGQALAKIRQVTFCVRGVIAPTLTHRRGNGELRMPWMIGAGAAYRFSDALMLALDLQWMQWSQYSYIENGEKVNPLNGLASASFAAKDTIAVRTGLEYVIINERTLVPLRCGLAYEQSPTLDGVDEFQVATVGAGYQRGRYMFDVAYELRSGTKLTGRTRSSVAGNSLNELRQRLLLSLIVYF